MNAEQVYIKDKDERLEQALNDVLTAAESDADYDIAFAKAYLAAEGSIEARKAATTIATEKYLKARNDAKAVKEFLRAKLKDRQDAVSARQTLLNSELRTNRAF